MTTFIILGAVAAIAASCYFIMRNRNYPDVWPESFEDASTLLPPVTEPAGPTETQSSPDSSEDEPAAQDVLTDSSVLPDAQPADTSVQDAAVDTQQSESTADSNYISTTTEQPRLLYKVGLMSDMHYDVDDSHKSEFEDDITNALHFFKDSGVEFIASCGDFAQYNDNDFYGFASLYKKHAPDLRLFSPMGNHDYLLVYDERQKTDPNYKDESQRQMMWQDTIADLHCHTDVDDRKSSEAEDDIHFFEYGARWDDPKHTGERTIKSKLSYWTERHGDIYVFLSVDYGDDMLPGQWGTLANAISLLDKNSPDVQRMMDYVSDTEYNMDLESRFDYQFYHPSSLIWLQGLIEDNPDKMIFVFSHHYLTHKAGGNSPLDGKWFYSQMRIWPYTEDERIRKRYYSGANSLSGLEFHFLNKLNNMHQNVVWFSGHTHIRWSNMCYDRSLNFCTEDYDFIKPDGTETVPLVDDIWQFAGTQYDYRRYTRMSNTSRGKCGLNVHLPSLSKPIDISSGHGTTIYGASEGAIMEVWSDKVVIKGYTFKDAGETGYKNEISVQCSTTYEHCQRQE